MNPGLPDYLRADAPPSAICDRCGRKTWGDYELPALCAMPQPDGTRCPGKLQPVAEEQP